MLHIKRIEEAAPCVPVVVRLDDVFTAVVQVAVAEQKTEAPQPQVVLVIALDRVRDKNQSDLVDGPMPARAEIVRSSFHRLIHFGVSERLVLAFVPSKSAKGAEVRCQLLLGV